ncbi:VOC family protein [Metabacillus litoralis]|uniref:VOC family protein n=1 Tax=Metabacillus litoralis TaxID=152268 RepID=UPI001CFF3EB2|nr:VOC family protein [Metabacillus litoralis]
MSIKILGLDHIQICVPIGKETLARQFYLDVLNFIEIEKPDVLKKNGGFWCTSGEITLHIGVEEMRETISKRHPAFIISNLEEVRGILKSKGVLIQEETSIPGIERFSCFDPFHNRIEFLEKI